MLRAVADESALKVVELSAGKITTMAETPLGLRHGPMSSVDGQTLFVAFLSTEARRRGYELDLLREIDRKRLGRVRAVVTAGELDDVTSLADFFLSLNCAADFPDDYRPTSRLPLERLPAWFNRSNSIPDPHSGTAQTEVSSADGWSHRLAGPVDDKPDPGRRRSSSRRSSRIQQFQRTKLRFPPPWPMPAAGLPWAIVSTSAG